MSTGNVNICMRGVGRGVNCPIFHMQARNLILFNRLNDRIGIGVMYDFLAYLLLRGVWYQLPHNLHSLAYDIDGEYDTAAGNTRHTATAERAHD